MSWLGDKLFGDVKSYPRGKDKQLSENFHLSEFECKCGECETTLVSKRHVRLLQRLRTALGAGILVTSGYRCEAHNAAVGGLATSQHKRGTATDVVVDGFKSSTIAELCEDDFDGIGVYDDFVHLDSRGHRARWGRPEDAS